jgi:hypothetical protein
MPNAAERNGWEDRTMTPKSRSLSGAMLALVLIPIFAGLLACMPVPIGDPERSRIDPEMTGVWAVLSSGEYTDAPGFYVFEPYDKRTWLVSGAGLEEGDDSDLSKYDLSLYEGFVELAATEPARLDNIYIERIGFYKAWLKKLGGEVFMTWEPKLALDDGIAEPELWFVYRIFKDGPDTIRMQLVNGESDLFKDVKKTRRAYERVISKNADNPELYGFSENENIEAFATLARVQETEVGFFEALLELLVASD